MKIETDELSMMAVQYRDGRLHFEPSRLSVLNWLKRYISKEIDDEIKKVRDYYNGIINEIGRRALEKEADAAKIKRAMEIAEKKAADAEMRRGRIRRWRGLQADRHRRIAKRSCAVA